MSEWKYRINNSMYDNYCGFSWSMIDGIINGFKKIKYNRKKKKKLKLNKKNLKD